MKKRLLSLLLCLAMVFTMLPFGAFAEGEEAEEPVQLTEPEEISEEPAAEEPEEEIIIAESEDEIVIAEPVEEEEDGETTSLLNLTIDHVFDETYRGVPITPNPWIWNPYKSEYLTLGVDYTISYKNNVNAAKKDAVNSKGQSIAPTVIIKGKGNYTGTRRITFNIYPRDVYYIATPNCEFAYTGKPVKLDVKATWNDYQMKLGRDYVFENSDGNTITTLREAGYYNLILKGVGNFTGSTYVSLELTSKRMMSSCTVSKIPNQKYTGYGIYPDVKVTDPKTKTVLTAGVDYVVNYQNNVEVGTAEATIIGIGAYAGYTVKTFKITGTSLSTAKIAPIPDKTYNGWDQRPEPIVTIQENGVTKTLQQYTDYDLEYDKNFNAGTAKVTVIGMGAYTGKKTVTFRIKPYDAAADSSTIMMNYVYSSVRYGVNKRNGAVEIRNNALNYLLVEGKDYTLSFVNNKNVRNKNDLNPPTVTVKFKGNYTGTFSKAYSITQTSMSYAVLYSIDKIYNGKSGAWKLVPTLKYHDVVLKPGVDFDKNIEYFTDQACTNPFTDGAAYVGQEVWMKVTGKGHFRDTIKYSYKLRAIDIARATVKVSSVEFHNGIDQPSPSQVTVTHNGHTLEIGVDYSISFGSAPGGKGTGTIIINGIGLYGGTKTVKYKVTAGVIEP